MYTVILILWLASGERAVVSLDEITFQTRKACVRAAPYLARVKARELPPLERGKARCVEVGDET